MAEPRSNDLTACLLALAAEHPSAVALRAPGRPAMSFGELGSRIHAVGARLGAWGIGRGDIVAWTTDARAESAAALAIMPVAATLAPLDPGMTADAYLALLQRLKPKAVATPAGSEHPIGEAARRLGIAEISVVPDANGAAGAFDLELSRPEASLESVRVAAPEMAYVSATSGTTGRPKLVPHGQRQIMLTVRAMGECLAMGPGDVSAHVAPLHLANGIRASFLLSLIGGGAVACLPVGDVDAFLAAVENGEISYTSASYTFMRELLQRVDAGRRVGKGRLRLLRVASGRLEPDEMDRLATAFDTPIVTGLASTESGFVAHQRLPPAVRSRDSVGPPLACEIRLVDEQGHKLAPGAIGEIQVRGPQVFAGYFDDPELTARAFAGDWFRMGDLGRFDDDGELHVVGRIDDVINRGGEKISPVEIDAVLRTIPGVADAAAFAMPHPRLGEELVAAVVRMPGNRLDAQSAMAQARARLGPRRAPRHLWFVDALPRNHAGKLLRRSLPEWVRRTPAANSPVADSASALPRSPLETALAGLWAGALGLAAPGRDDNFFMLGGDSLRGAQLLNEVSAVFGVALPVEALFDDAGTIAAMARRIETERAGRAARASVLTIPRRAAGEAVPLSGTQARVWFLQRLDPDSAAYHEARWWHIDGPLDVGALRMALAAVAVRQPMLRTRFVTVASLPCQVIDPEPLAELEIVTLAAAGRDEEQRLEEAVRERALRPFDLAAATPLRWTLFELAGGRHALLRVWHHILGDGISARALHKDLSDAYAAARGGSDPTLPALPIDYADYAAWQAKERGGAKQAQLLAFWKARLADLPVLALPTDFHRPTTPSFRGGRVTTTLPREAVVAFQAFGRKEGATPFIAFLAAFAALLSRLSGDEDLALGTPVAGRPAPELAEVIGFFANTVVLRADLSGAPTAMELLRRMRDRVLEAIEHQDLPFATLVEALGAPRDPSRNPLFQVAFSMVNRERVDLHLAGLEVRPMATSIEQAKFDLTLTLVEAPDRIDARWEFCTDLFARATIERIARQYEALVAAMAAAPDQTVATLPLMDDATRARVAEAARGPGFDYPATTTIPERFSMQAQATPGAKAIEALDYAGVEAAANRLARELRAQGVATGAIVAVARRRSADIAVAWLAVLKFGAAYLPVDPDVPPERLAFMLADAKVTHVIADDALAAMFAGSGVCVVRPERDAERIAACAADTLEATAGPDDAAYVIYTSGSTGAPKGVVVPHRAVLRLVCGTDCAQLGPEDTVAQIANPAFDASTFEFWGALLNGARIVPIAKTTAIAPRALAAAIAGEGVTALFLTTALFNIVAGEVPDAFRACRYVLFGGEAVEPGRVAAVIRAGPPRHLLHVYGPTEATTFATWHEVRDVAPNAATIPIGRPLANTEVYLLRPDFELAAPGEPGEICIGGPALALGYLNPSAQSADCFVERTIAHYPPRRLYRSGDLGRLRDDGAIEFLGRRDRQVKIRGHRIELEEIEAVIARLPQVRAAAVAVRGDTTESRQLVAYVVSAAASGPPPSNLWRDLRPILPEYMLPASIVWLPSLPLNASGKIDRRALPAVRKPGAPRAGVRVAPRDMFEQVLVRIWEKLLNIREVGVFDRFFEIGGHSLLAARLVDEIERETGLAAPLTALFVDDTIAGLARVLREGAPDLKAPIVTIHGDGTLPPFVFLHGDFTGGGFYSRALAQALGPDQPVLIVHPHGLVDATIPETIEAMAADRLRAVRAIRPHGPYVLGGHCNGAFVAFEMARQLLQQGEQVPAVVLIEARAPSGRGTLESPAGEAYVRFDPDGGVRIMAPRDRQSDAELRYARAMDRYAGGPCATHIVIVRSRTVDDARRDLGWSRLATSAEIHGLPGDHITLITRHTDELAQVVRAAIVRACERAIQ
jgi:amino acid adenylation domain-containing protein